MVMALISGHVFLSPLISLHSLSFGWVSQCFVPPKRAPIMAASSSSASLADQKCGGAGLGRLLEFPHVSAAHKDLLVEVVSAFEARLGFHVLPCSLPPDVQYYENQDGTAQASLNIRSGIDSSPIDFVVGSWLHCPLPSGGALDITSFFTYLKASTDAPNFLIELIRCSPTSMILFLDLFPRTDLVLHPDYRKTFYEDTRLESYRQLIEKIPEVQPYFASSLYVRCFASPTAIMGRIETEAGGPDRMEEILRSHVAPVAKDILGIWLDEFAFREREVGDSERAHLEKRDAIMKRQSIEIDLCSSLPRLFGPEIAGRVSEAVRRVYNL